MGRPRDRSGDCGLIRPPLEVTEMYEPVVKGASFLGARGGFSNKNIPSKISRGSVKAFPCSEIVSAVA